MRSTTRVFGLGLLSLLATTGMALAQYDNLPQAACPPDEIEHSPQVCFFTETDYGGHYFCETGCRTVNQVAERWRNQIKSIEVRDGASVRICSEFDRRGDCDVVDTNTRELEEPFYNHVYSYRTED